jgi:uncharacterized coiled-coil protein SlyX
VTTSRNGHFTALMPDMVDQQAREWIQALEQQVAQRDREVAELSSTVSRLAATVEAIRASLGLLSQAVSTIPSAPAHPAPSVSAANPAADAPWAGGSGLVQRALPPARATNPPDAPSSAAAPDPRPPISRPLSPPIAPPLSAPLSPPLSPQTPSLVPSAAVLLPAPAGFASLIVADFPGLFAEFYKKSFALLWRGSRDGFGALDFHDRCDGHAPTLTLIQDTDGNIFGGFTPVKWESRRHEKKHGQKDNRFKADSSLQSFLFTLKNPHNFPAGKFALKAEKKDRAIWCAPSWGPYFHDIGVSDNCNANAVSLSFLGDAYAGGTSIDGETVLTGSHNFTVKEIEVFEITD